MPIGRLRAAVIWAMTCSTVGCHEFIDPDDEDVPPIPQILEVRPSFTAVGHPEAWVSVRTAERRSTSVLRWNGSDLVMATDEPWANDLTEDWLRGRLPATATVAAGHGELTVYTPSETPGRSGSSSTPAVHPVAYADPVLATWPFDPPFLAPGGGDTAVEATGWGFTPLTEVSIDGEPVAVEILGFHALRFSVSGSLLTGDDELTIEVRHSGRAVGPYGRKTVPVMPPIVADPGQRHGLANGCILEVDGGLRCWDPVPRRVAEAISFTSLDGAARSHYRPHSPSCVRTDGGEVYCFGSPSSIRGDGGAGGFSATPDVPVAGDHTFHGITVGAGHACALDEGGHAWCWGDGSSGQLGTDHALEPCPGAGGGSSCALSPVPVGGDAAFVVLAAGNFHTCGLNSEGVALCWGSAQGGALGIGPADGDAPLPTRVATDLTFQTIAAGGGSTCALTAQGAAHCWGDNHVGQLGVGDNVDRHTPEPVASGHAFVSVALGADHSCAIATDGAAYCWGSNYHGQLGTGDNAPRNAPTLVEGGHEWSAIHPELVWTCGITSAAVVLCWGDEFMPYAVPINQPDVCHASKPIVLCYKRPAPVLGSPAAPPS
jgi:hypothetical protein